MIKTIWLDVIGTTGYLILERVSEMGMVVEWWELVLVLKETHKEKEKKEWKAACTYHTCVPIWYMDAKFISGLINIWLILCSFMQADVDH